MRKKCITLGVMGLTSMCAVVNADIDQNPNAKNSNYTLQNQSSVSTIAPIYKAKDYSHLLGMPGFSDNALNTHFKLYQGYVTNANLLLSIIQKYNADGKNRTPEYAEIKRRLGWELDGIKLHEYYFDNLGGKGETLDSSHPLYAQMNKDFGSFDNWKSDFVATGVMRGIGWAVLYRDPSNGKLMNLWIDEHDVGHLAGGEPILIMDVWEHAYMPDYGTDRAKYIDAFFKDINWDVVSNRYLKTQAK